VRLKGFPEGVSSVAISPAGRRVAAAGGDGRVVVWESGSGAEVVAWKMPGAVYRVAFAPDSRQLATANANGTVYLFALPQSEQTATSK